MNGTINDTKVLRACGYCRTSSEGQRDNTSIGTQKADIKRYIEARGWQFVGWYVDECKSGSRIEGRDEFQRAMRDATNNGYDVLVCYDAKRYGRKRLGILGSAQTLKMLGKRLVTTLGGFDTDSTSVIINYVEAGIAEEERLTILRRTKSGKVARARQHNAP